MKKKRILYIEANKDGTIGGSYYSLLYLIQGLNRERYEPMVMFCGDNELVPQYEHATGGVLIFDYNPTSSEPERGWIDYAKLVPRLFRHVLAKQWKLRRMLLDIKPDLVHLNNTYIFNHDWILACRLNGVKVVSHDRGSQSAVSIQTRLFSRMLDALICVSDANLNVAREQNLRPKRLRRVYNGLDPDVFKNGLSPSNRKEVRGELGIGEGELLVGMVGNIDCWKGQSVFVKAMQSVMLHHAGVKAVIAGKTARGAERYEEEIRRYLGDHGIDDRVSLIGFRRNVAALLDAMDIFVHASIEPEPFGRVILEAMMMGKPIVATDGGGVPELLAEGPSGILVPMNDHETMARAIERLIVSRETAGEFGGNALRRSKLFTVERMVAGVEQVYREIFD